MNTSYLAIIKHEIYDKAIERINYTDNNGILLEDKKFCYSGAKLPLFLIRLPFALAIGIYKAIISFVWMKLFKGYIHKYFFTAYFRKEYEGHIVANYDTFYAERNKIQKRINTLRKRHLTGELESDSNSGFLYEEVEIL